MTGGGLAISPVSILSNMGLLRLYLALCVVAEHSHAVFPWQMHGGTKAVQIFYIISGFYMAMVLSTKYTSTADFYKSRALRIFPPYYAVLLLVVVWSLVFGSWTGNHLSLNSLVRGIGSMDVNSGMWFAAVSNLTVFFQDTMFFLTQPQGQSLAFTADFLSDKAPLSRFLIIPPAWSIAVELTFYSLVPFLNRFKTKVLILLMLACVSGRVIVYEKFGLSHDPWTYRFFPFEMATFILGMLAFRLYDAAPLRNRLASLAEQAKGMRYLAGTAFLLAFFCFETKCVGRVGLLISQQYAVLSSLLFWPIAVVLLFAWSRNSRFDRLIGELSFPVYLIHLTIIYTLKDLYLKAGYSMASIGVSSAILSILIAWILYRFLLHPFDAKRSQWTSGKPS